MIYDFIEIGTSNIETLIEHADDNVIGLSIEPIRHYLDSLPDKRNVKKVNVAVSATNLEEPVEVFFVPEDVIDEKNLPLWLKGCNCIGRYHYQHTQYHPSHDKENILDLVQTEVVMSVPIGKLFDEYDVTGITYLKIDTEGSDCDILQHYYEYLKTKPKSYYPKKIRFESNELTTRDKIEKVRELFNSIGYNFPEIGWPDTVLELL
jgi:hypothetical protein